MMTRKDYVETSNILVKYKEHLEFGTYLDLVYEFADWFAEDNPNFDEKKFANACGLDVK